MESYASTAGLVSLRPHARQPTCNHRRPLTHNQRRRRPSGERLVEKSRVKAEQQHLSPVIIDKLFA